MLPPLLPPLRLPRLSPPLRSAPSKKRKRERRDREEGETERRRDGEEGEEKEGKGGKGRVREKRRERRGGRRRGGRGVPFSFTAAHYINSTCSLLYVFTTIHVHYICSQLYIHSCMFTAVCSYRDGLHSAYRTHPGRVSSACSPPLAPAAHVPGAPPRSGRERHPRLRRLPRGHTLEEEG